LLSICLIAQVPATLDYRVDMMPIVDQGKDGNCLASAAAAMREWRLYKESGVKKYFDAKYIYDNRKDSDEIDPRDVGRIFNMKMASIKTIDELKAALYKNGPCIINIQMYNRTSRMWYPIDSKLVIGMHSMCIVGYNKDGFILRNSWGTGWGDKGYCIFPYTDWKWKWEVISYVDT